MAHVSNRDNILILGGGDGLAAREILKYKDVKNVTIVDLDPAVTKIFKKSFSRISILTKNSLNFSNPHNKRKFLSKVLLTIKFSPDFGILSLLERL